MMRQARDEERDVQLHVFRQFRSARYSECFRDRFCRLRDGPSELGVPAFSRLY